MLLSIIIVNYNVKYFVEQCLHSIFQSEGIDTDEVEVFVVDNASNDHSVSYLSSRFTPKNYPHLHVIANKRNVGFGRANNQAVRRAKGMYVLFLNPDTLLTERTLVEVLKVAEEKVRFGALGVKMLHSDGTFALESRRGLPSPWTSFCKMIGLNTLFPRSRTFGRYYMQYLPQNDVCEIDIVSGACMCVAAEALKQTGGFDETFFMYGEDIDLSYRLKKLGLKNYYLPAPLLHYKGESTQKGSFRYVHVFYEAMLIFFRKHYKHYNLLLSLPIKLAIILRACLALILQQVRYLKKFLSPRGSKMPQRMLYIGRSQDLVAQIAEEYGIDVDYYNADAATLPQGHTDVRIHATPYNYIVYDTADYPVSTILHIFAQHPQKNVCVGTFNPKTGVLITPNHVYSLA